MECSKKHLKREVSRGKCLSKKKISDKHCQDRCQGAYLLCSLGAFWSYVHIFNPSDCPWDAVILLHAALPAVKSFPSTIYWRGRLRFPHFTFVVSSSQINRLYVCGFISGHNRVCRQVDFENRANKIF